MVKSVVMGGMSVPVEEPTYTSDEIQALEARDVSESGHPIVGWVEDKFNSAEDAKRNAEERALKAYNNFRGNYNGDTMFTESEKSRIFIKVTKTKVLAAYGQVIDVLFGNHTFPLTIDHTTLPEGVTEDVSFDPMAPPAPQKQNAIDGTRQTFS